MSPHLTCPGFPWNCVPDDKEAWFSRALCWVIYLLENSLFSFKLTISSSKYVTAIPVWLFAWKAGFFSILFYQCSSSLPIKQALNNKSHLLQLLNVFKCCSPQTVVWDFNITELIHLPIVRQILQKDGNKRVTIFWITFL